MECVFCGTSIRQGVQGNLSEEHPFAKWLQDRIGARHKQIQNVTENVADGSQRKFLHTLERFVAKRVCKGCNEGWMNSLEIKTAVLLEPIFLGQASIHDLSFSDQEILLRWAMKTALAVIAASPAKDMVAPTSHYRLLTNEDPIPKGVHCIAGHLGSPQGRFGLYMIPRMSLCQDDYGDSLSKAELAESYTVMIHFGNTFTVVRYCSAPQHVLVMDRRIHWPVSRQLAEYGWYQRVDPSRRIFDDERQMWDDFVRGIWVMKTLPQIGSLIRVDEDMCVVSTQPNASSYPNPPPI